MTFKIKTIRSVIKQKLGLIDKDYALIILDMTH